MAITLDSLPRDANGAICGIWRVHHRLPDYNGQIAMYDFRDGATLRPVWGRQLAILAADCGSDLFMVPWTGDIPPGSPLPEVYTEPTEAQLAALDPLPWADDEPVAPAPQRAETGDTGAATAQPEDISKLKNADLIERLEALGVEVPPKANKSILVDLLRAAEEVGALGDQATEEASDDTPQG